MITILGDVPSKKNSKRIFVRNGRPVVLPSLSHQEWHEQAMWQLKRMGKPVPVKGYKIMTLTFYPSNKRKADLSNKCESVMDLLVDAGFLEDDNYFVVPKLTLQFGGIDKTNPRA